MPVIESSTTVVSEHFREWYRPNSMGRVAFLSRKIHTERNFPDHSIPENALEVERGLAGGAGGTCAAHGSREVVGGHLGEGGAQVLVRVDRHVVDAHFVVKVGSGGAAGLADVADDLAAGDVLAGEDDHAGEVSVDGVDAVAVVDGDFAAVPVFHGGQGDEAV